MKEEDKAYKNTDYSVKTVEGKRLVFFKGEELGGVVKTVEVQDPFDAADRVCHITLTVIANCE